ncbi:MAG: carbon-nitrogen hydrolase family protein [Deltaproteobacteria bacterium]|jgi:predicted amidohydrolase|nr:carbon-nitrogen hydrolase family protein [Deltaproteobacteria bacterium]MBW2535573.1 carbon-nitrogen hydrolase family protein [Deltaproteobacteria bacterium]
MSTRIAAVQMCCQDELADNLRQMSGLCARAAEQGAEIIVLPENFAYLGPETGKRELAEDLTRADGPIMAALARAAQEHQCWLVAGGMPERSADRDRPYSVCAVIAPDGSLAAKYRKIHLFDIDLGDGVDYCEPRATTPGDEPVVANVAGVPVGLSICYDLRFPELYRRLTAEGARVLAVPAAFTLQTGKDHWMPLLRARAIENQSFVVAAGQWGSHGARQSYGKTCIIDPWGAVIAQVSEGEGVVTAALDFGYLEAVRAKLPALEHRRLEP